MSSDDYVDACDRLSQLTLTDVQQREIVRVLLHCCGNEKTYNPYYTLIGQNLCRQSHSHRVTLQYCLWDFLRSLGESGVGGAEMVDENHEGAETDFMLDHISGTRVTNIAKAYAWWIAKDSVAITVLKPLDFVSLKPKTRSFLWQFFTHLFVYSQSSSSTPSINNEAAIANRDARALEEIAQKAVRLVPLTRGVVHFLSREFREPGGEKLDGLIQWAVGVFKAALLTGLETQTID